MFQKALRSVAVTFTMEGFGATREACNPWWVTMKQGRVPQIHDQIPAFLRESWAARSVCLPRFRENHKSSQIVESIFFNWDSIYQTLFVFHFYRDCRATSDKELVKTIIIESTSKVTPFGFTRIHNGADHVATVMQFSCNTNQLSNL